MTMTYNAGGYTITLPPLTEAEREHFRALAACDADMVELDGPVCDVCDDTGEVRDAPGAGGRAILPCHNCDAYDNNQRDADERAADLWKD